MGKKIQYIGRYVMDGEILGKGNFARVELATHGVTGCKVAIKVIDTRKIKEDYVKQNLHREARILGQLRHPNIIRLYETLKATTLYCLVTEYASGGELLAFIKQNSHCRLVEDKARPFVRQLISAVHYLHERGVAHRDLKMENIMLDEKKKNIKICDFGLSNTFTHDELMKTHCGSPEYAAPELFTASEKYGPEIDIWSVGIIMYAMVVGKLPFTTPYTDQYRRQKLLQQIEKGLVEQHDREMMHLMPECQDLIRKVIEPTPELRLPLMDIEIHPWLTLDAKLPFYPFQSLPKDKANKSQVVEELASLLDTDKTQLEKTVHECRCDEISAMFNMMLQRKRIEDGLFDVDHTQKTEQKVEKPRSRSRQRAKSATRNQKSKGSTRHKTSHGKSSEANHVTIEAHPDTEGAEKPHESTTSASFDLLALCSTPSWLGPERRRSRRRSRAPPSSPSPYAEAGATGSLATAVSGLGAAMVNQHSGSSKSKGNSLKPDNSPPHSLSLTVPDRLPVPLNSDQMTHNDTNDHLSRRNSHGSHGCLSRDNSLKVPSRENSFKRIHYRHSDKRPSSCGPTIRRRTHSLRKHRTLEVEISIDFAVPVSVPIAPIPVPNSPKASPKAEERRHSPIPRPVKLGLRECLSASPTRLNVRSSKLVPPNGPQTSVEIQLSDYSNPCSATALDDDHGSNSREALIKVELNTDSRAASLHTTGSNGKNTLNLAENPVLVVCENLKSDSFPPDVRPKDNSYVCASVRRNPCESPPVYDLTVDEVPSPYSSRLRSSSSSNSSDSLLESMQINKLASLCDKDTPISTLSTDLFSRADSDDLGGLSPLSLDFRDLTDGMLLRTQKDISNLYKGPANRLPSRDVGRETMCNLGNIPLRGNVTEPLNCAKGCNSTITTQHVSLCKNDNANVPCDHNVDAESDKLNLAAYSRNRTWCTADASSSRVFGDRNSVAANCAGGKSMSRNHDSSINSLQTPSTPTKQMLRTPIARVESFHSDDFDEYQTGEVPVLRTPTPQTPTLSKFPLFGKGSVKKSSGNSKHSKDKMFSKFTSRCGKDANRVSDKNLRLEPGITESLLESAGSEVLESKQEGSTDKLTSNKVHPKEDVESENLKAGGSKSKLKSQDHSGNTVTADHPKLSKQKQKTGPEKSQLLNAQESKKKPALKTSPWKRSFAHFLRKTKPARNVNHKDVVKDGELANSQQHPNNSNGHAHSPVSKTAPVTTVNDKREIDKEHSWPAPFSTPLHNNISDAIEVNTSPTSCHEPSNSTVHVFDFTSIQPNPESSPKSKSRFLSWRGCGECARSDTSSEEELECAIRLEQLGNTVQKPTSGANNIGEPRQSNVPSENVCC